MDKELNIMAKHFVLTTSDNPWNPITQEDEWLVFDEKEKHYNTCSFLARQAALAYGFSDEYNVEQIEAAIDQIVKDNYIRFETDNKVCYMKFFYDESNPNEFGYA